LRLYSIIVVRITHSQGESKTIDRWALVIRHGPIPRYASDPDIDPMTWLALYIAIA
jgi:hypothetical protein